MSETLTVRKWLVARLGGDATLAGLVGTRIYFGVAPESSAFPYITLQLQSPGTDLLTLGAHRIWSDTLWLLKAWAKGASGVALEPIVDRIDALLHNVQATTADGSIWSSVREAPFDQVEVDGGVFYASIGAEYRIKVVDH